MKKLVLLLLVAFAILASCAKDIVIAPPSELRGFYEGSYKVVYNYGSSTGSTTDEEYLDWTFSDQKFFLNAARLDEKEAITFNMSGDYSLQNKMVFSNIATEPGTFRLESIPEGEFDYTTIRYEGAKDTLRFYQLEGEENSLIEKTIKLVKVD